MSLRRILLPLALVGLGLALAPLGAGCGGSKSSSGGGQSTIVMNPPSGTVFVPVTVATPYSQSYVVASGGVAPFTFTAVSSTPDGLVLASYTQSAAALSGTPTRTGTSIITLQVVDATRANIANVTYTLTIR